MKLSQSRDLLRRFQTHSLSGNSTVTFPDKIQKNVEKTQHGLKNFPKKKWSKMTKKWPKNGPGTVFQHFWFFFDFSAESKVIKFLRDFFSCEIFSGLAGIRKMSQDPARKIQKKIKKWSKMTIYPLFNFQKKSIGKLDFFSRRILREFFDFPWDLEISRRILREFWDFSLESNQGSQKYT
jgi:hypothetical protein